MEGGKRALCLGCGASGPEREGSQEAMLALRDEARHPYERRPRAGEIGA